MTKEKIYMMALLYQNDLKAQVVKATYARQLRDCLKDILEKVETIEKDRQEIIKKHTENKEELANEIQTLFTEELEVSFNSDIFFDILDKGEYKLSADKIPQL